MTSQGGILKNTTGQDRPIWQEFVFCVFCPFWSASIICQALAAWHYTPDLGLLPQFTVCNALLPGHYPTKTIPKRAPGRILT